MINFNCEKKTRREAGKKEQTFQPHYVCTAEGTPQLYSEQHTFGPPQTQQLADQSGLLGRKEVNN